MNSAAQKHSQGVAHFQAGDLSKAAECLREALWQEESAELWSDWAAVEFAAGRAEEAEAGFRLALEIDPQYAQAALNLAALLTCQSRANEALPLLQPLRTAASQKIQSAAEQLLARMSERPKDSTASLSDLEAYLRRFLSDDPNERSYFETHVRRYVETLALLPHGAPAMRVLELGAAFHHVTPALLHSKGYAEVRCNDIWQGGPHTIRHLTSRDGEQFSFLTDNFDVQATPWPYADGSFDVVLFCEMLEHLHSDPMAVLAEINRVLKSGGFLLLTTPNLASCHAVEYALKGESPYVYGKFERNGTPTDRHNREYTAGEVERLAVAAGFDSQVLRTNHSWWQPQRKVFRLLAARGYPIARRGDNVLLLARKATTVRDRFPEEFYLTLGTQADRRVLQEDATSVNHATAVSSMDVAAPDVLAPQNILVIHDLIPHFDRSGSDLRLMDVLRELRAQGHRVTLLARDAGNADCYRPAVEKLGIRVIAGDPDRMRHVGSQAKTEWSLQKVLEEGNFQMAILCHWFWSGIPVSEQYLPEIRAYSPCTRIAILTDDRHGERERRSAALSGHLSDLERGNNFEARELEIYNLADLLLYITEADGVHFARLLPELPMEHLPMVAPDAPEGPGFGAREGVLFLGNFENLANRDALDWMLKRVWPLVQKRDPKLKLYVAGHAAPKEAASKHSGVVLVGHVPELAPLFAQYRVFAAPVRFGTGINTKNLQAMIHGVPVVTTSVGAEGLQTRHGEHVLIADTAENFSNALLHLAGDELLWTRLAEEGREFIRRSFSQEHLRSQLSRILNRLYHLKPKTLDSRFLPSYREVESRVPEILSQEPIRYRLVLRTLAYWQIGKRDLEAGRADAALASFRHIFTSVRGMLPDTVLHRQLLLDMARAYRSIGNSGGALRCDSELRNLVSLDSGPLPPERRPKRDSQTSKKGCPELSVVVPTFNRKHVLRLCLAALAFQTLPANRWEVIVVDDGSTDGTGDFCRDSLFPFSLQYIRRQNQGAGGARRAGVEVARGEFVLLINDDTIASSTLLSEHLRAHRANPHEHSAVLGNFVPSEACAGRALSLWVNTSPFFFPQQNLKPGLFSDAALFVTCNLSVPREAVVTAGNFDPSFRVAEDTELGARLLQLGYRVRYHPSSAATHEHGRFTTQDLLRRARAYGAADWKLFQLHPELLGDGGSPFGKLEESDFRRIAALVEEKREAVSGALSALEALDKLDLWPMWAGQTKPSEAIDSLLRQLSRIVPMVYWYHLLEVFLAEWQAARGSSVCPAAGPLETAVPS